MKKITSTAICIMLLGTSAFASSDNLLEFEKSNVPVTNVVPKAQEEKSGIFSLTTIMDSFLNLGGQSENANLDESEKQRIAFVNATKKFNQGNVVVAYDEFENLSSSINSDYALLVFAKSMYEIGFFSIGTKSLEKIKHKKFVQDTIDDLKRCYLPSFTLDKNEEIYLAKAYSSIHYDNSAQEISFELNKNEALTSKSDYANYILSQAMSESRQYQQALNFINKASSMNKTNLSYLNFKVKTLNALNKNKEALEIIEQVEKNNANEHIFKNSFMLQKETILANLSKDEQDRKYHQTMKTFMEGNYQKAIEDCKNILSFDKKNYKILTLLAMGQFVTGDRQSAKKNYLASYEINKNYPYTLSGLGDVKFLEYDLEGAIKYYKKALSQNPKDQTSALKLALIYKNDTKYEKDLKNLEKKLAKMDSAPFMSYHSIAATIAKDNKNLRREYIRRATAINPLYENGWVAFLNYELENKDLDGAKNFLYMISFSNRTNYIYFYLNALYDIALNRTNSAIVNLRNCLSLKPDFEDANKKLIQLIPSEIKPEAEKQVPQDFIDQPVL